ncbi:hypothetical protein GCM10028796_19550 [Ramlibacter monticola]|uniref:Uncharacterized protein n=1 Tax=Ramlibacter monticola TaxID=1926872 RepID=A0A936Z278_9BURK|nr:hypothetical protein [Ramlibacter monticola]MBL0392212.1 hypothetical protein [Ramlibacter monticola]
MASFIRVHYPSQHAGVARVEEAIKFIGGFSATRAVLHGLAFLGSPATRLAARARAGMAAWRVERKQREEDRKLWNLALTDARVMADLSRAMSQEALRNDARPYF